MSRFLARLIGLLFVATLATGAASALAAARFKKAAPPLPEPADDEIDLAVVMDGASFASTATAFRGGRVICWYAGTDVDLRRATFDPAGAALEVRTVFGGTRIAVPRGVPVSVAGPAVFGGVMHEGGELAPPASVGTAGLAITGFTLFGGLQVVAADPDEELEDWGPERDAGAAGSHRADPGDATATPADALPVEPDAAGA